MNTHEFNVSVIDPVSPAIERARVMLFKPFDMRKWFVIGFCAWLAFLGSGGGLNFNFSVGDRRGGTEAREAIEQVKDYISCNLDWIIPVAIFLVLLLIVLGIVFVWLSSRGRFMFLHCVAENKAEVKVPWTKFKQHGNSLFLFRIVLGLIALAVMVMPVVFAIFAAIALARTKAHVGLVLVPVGIAFVILYVVILICFALVHKFTTDFVVPIMFLRSTSCRAAWREFLSLLSANKGRFTLYILFQILIAMAIGVIGASVACLFSCLLLCFTCGIAGCLMILPPLSIGYGYIITVLLLPLSVFKRAYSLHYIRQFGLEFDVFSPETEPA